MKKNTKKIILILAGGITGICVILIVIALIYNATPQGQAANATSTQEALALVMTETARPTNTETPTNTPIPSSTVTNTPLPTSTPKPTNTPIPTATSTPLPQPLSFSGKGDQVLDINKWDGAAIMDVKYTGGGNFVIWNYDSAGEKIDLLVNTIGSYSGKVPLDFMTGEATARLQIESSGTWTITISPLSLNVINVVQVPGTYQGSGDDVVGLDGTPDTGTFSTQTHDNFVVWSYSSTGGKDLLVNEIGPYSGTKVMDKNTFLLVISSGGAWSMDIK